MSTLAPAQSAAHAPPLRISVESVRCALLWLTGFSGAFVFIEPSPYEIMSLFTAMIFAVSGLTLQAGLVPLLTLLFFYNLGFWIAVVPVVNEDKTLLWVLISAYLSVTAIFYAAMLTQNTQRRLTALCRGFVAGAIVAALAGMIGFFNLVPQLGDLFMLYERSRGTFNDPNVLGAFLILPAMLALQRIYAGRFSQILGGILLLALFSAAVLLSFSRGAWGQLAFSAMVMTLLLFLTSRSPQQRLRITVLAGIAVVALAIVVVLLYSVESIGEMFRQRATLEQSYDTGHFGRFGRYSLGFDLALDKPWGLGPFQFRRLFVEDPHDVFLNSFMAGGWLSGFCYFTLICVTVINGLRYIFVDTPWRSIYLAVYSVFLGITAESVIIDSDHWRHFFLLLGVQWGLMLATRSYLAQAAAHAFEAAPEPQLKLPPEIAAEPPAEPQPEATPQAMLQPSPEPLPEIETQAPLQPVPKPEVVPDMPSEAPPQPEPEIAAEPLPQPLESTGEVTPDALSQSSPEIAAQSPGETATELSPQRATEPA